MIGGDPQRYRALMPVTIVEKLAFGVPATVLFAYGQVPVAVLAFGVIDLALGAGFVLAWRATRRA